MHKVKSTHTIINIIHLILWIRSFQTYQHPRSNDINEVEEVRSQNKHKKGKKPHSASRKSISCRGEIDFHSAVFKKKTGYVQQEIDFSLKEIDFLSVKSSKNSI